MFDLLKNENHPDGETGGALLLRRVEETLYLHPGIDETAAVFLPIKGGDKILAAFVVPREKDLTTKDLEVFLINTGMLSTSERPQRYYLVEEIPKTPSGKCHRLKLIQEFGEE